MKWAMFMLCGLAAGTAFAAGDGDRGRQLYESRCAACHAIDYNGVGPAHRGVVGRKAGSAANFAYSDALTSSNVVWTEKTLAQWLVDPEKLIPGQKMGYSEADAKERADLIAFLKTQK